MYGRKMSETIIFVVLLQFSASHNQHIALSNSPSILNSFFWRKKNLCDVLPRLDRHVYSIQQDTKHTVWRLQDNQNESSFVSFSGKKPDIKRSRTFENNGSKGHFRD